MRVVMRGITRAELDAKLDVADLLSETWAKTTANSGGPPQPYAVQQDDGNQSLRWSAIQGSFFMLKSGKPLATKSGKLLLYKAQ